MAHVVHLQRCPGGRRPMDVRPSLRLIEGLGIEGDHHARPGSSRQVLLMAEEDCARFGLSPGEVRENIVTRGIDLASLVPGTRLRVGSAVLEITKPCEPCAFIDSLRPGLRARIGNRRGMLARVSASGEVRLGDPVSADHRPRS